MRRISSLHCVLWATNLFCITSFKKENVSQLSYSTFLTLERKSGINASFFDAVFKASLHQRTFGIVTCMSPVITVHTSKIGFVFPLHTVLWRTGFGGKLFHFYHRLRNRGGSSWSPLMRTLHITARLTTYTNRWPLLTSVPLAFTAFSLPLFLSHSTTHSLRTAHTFCILFSLSMRLFMTTSKHVLFEKRLQAGRSWEILYQDAGDEMTLVVLTDQTVVCSGIISFE